MSIREKLSKNPSVAAGIAVAAIVIGVAAIVVQARSTAFTNRTQAYFTTDDGQTFFADDSKKIAPFDKDGKQAVRAHVFKCGGKQVVGYLSRFSDDGLRAVEEVKLARAEKRMPKNLAALGSAGMEVKKPGAANAWVKGTDSKRVGEVRIYRCPGEKDAAKEVDPS